MISYLSKEQILSLHRRIIKATGGSPGLREESGLEAAVARPAATFDGYDLYPAMSEKAAALMHSLLMNHPFVDGNKRVAIAAAELFLEINGHRIVASEDDMESMALAAAAGQLGKEELTIWFKQNVTSVDPLSEE